MNDGANHPLSVLIFFRHLDVVHAKIQCQVIGYFLDSLSLGLVLSLPERVSDVAQIWPNTVGATVPSCDKIK